MMMPIKKQPGKPIENPLPDERPEIEPVQEPGEPPIPEEDPDIIPDEEPFITPPYEVPPTAEGP